MKQFFKFMFASMLGFFLTFVVIFFLMMAMLASLATFSKKDDVTVKPNSVLRIKLDKDIPDRASANPFDNIDFMTFKATQTIGLNDILNAIEKAKDDDNIKGIFLDISIMPAGMATIEEIREALLDFRESGKFIVAYGETITQKAYYLASAADKIYLMPEGIMLFQGLSAQLMFFKGTLEKLEIEPQIIRHGNFKSAIEPFVEEKMSPENREQMLKYITSTWENFTNNVAAQRDLTTEDLQLIADSLLILRDIENAVKYKMIDGMIFYDEFINKLKERLELDEDKDVPFISIAKYSKAANKKSKAQTKDRIAVIYATGEIHSGSGDERSIYSDDLSRSIRQARKNDNVKAVVLRVNSPGGSAIASEAILREALLTQQEKPFVVSFGNLAASGGYYIACAADKIISNHNTITGSIGVFGMIPYTEKFFNNKLGITFDVVKTNEQSDFGNLMRPLSEDERAILQTQVERVYDTFVNHVAEARGMTFDEVDAIGQGRIWTGTDALELGLVDELGGLQRAIEAAAELAEIEEYRVLELPRQKDFLTQIIEEMSGGISTRLIKKHLGSNYKYFKQLERIEQIDYIQARLPFDIEIN